MTIVVSGLADDQRDRVLAAAHGHPVLFPAKDGLDNALRDATAFAGTLPPTGLDAAPRLTWLHSWAAGVDSLLTPALVESDVHVTSATGNGGVPLAEHAMLLMLMLDRDAPRWLRAQTERSWDRFTHGELKGATVGIVGLGTSGADLALKARAFHMRVLGLRRRSDVAVEGVERVYDPSELSGFLAECDYVVITTPLTSATRGMFGADAFRAMKSTAHLICISRGGIIDDDALLAALDAGEIAGAGLDAHGIEPLPAASAFWQHPRVIVTPHNGATTAATADRGVQIFVDNVERFVAGRDLRNLVDKTAGY